MSKQDVGFDAMTNEELFSICVQASGEDAGATDEVFAAAMDELVRRAPGGIAGVKFVLPASGGPIT
jgi:hypothetical protein